MRVFCLRGKCSQDDGIPPQSYLSFPLRQALVRLEQILQLHCLFYRVIIFWFRQEDWFQVVEASLSALVNDIPLQDSSSCAKSSPCPGQIASPPPSVRKTSLVSCASDSGDPDVLFLTSLDEASSDDTVHPSEFHAQMIDSTCSMTK